MIHRNILVCAVLAAALMAAAVPAIAAPTTPAVPASDAYAMASLFTSAVPIHSQCTSLPYCRYLVTECASGEELGVPCGRDIGEEPEQAPPHQGTQCKCNYCPGYQGVICAIGHQ